MENISTENTDLIEARKLNDEELASVCGGLKVNLGLLPNVGQVSAKEPAGVAFSLPPLLE